MRNIFPDAPHEHVIRTRVRLRFGYADPSPALHTISRFDVQILIPDLNRFLKIADHEADLTGTVTCKPLGGPYPIRGGRFNLFSQDPESGMRQMSYAFGFTAADGQEYFLEGHKSLANTFR